MLIEIHEASKSYGSTRALDNVTMEIRPGEILVVLGINAAGKTTLLRAIQGMVGLTWGKILYDGEEFRRDNLAQRRRLGFLPDFPPYFPHYSVLRNVGIMVEAYEARRPGLEM